MERSEWVARFRERLADLIAREGVSRAAFAARIGLDRSTLSQLLSQENARLPRAETIAAIAQATQVSADWLLGLSQEGRPEAELLSGDLEVEPGAGSPVDERLRRWHAEAAGYKIRYVPSTLPDLLKTEEVIDYEYRQHGGQMPEVRLKQAESNLAYTRLPETEMEACCPYQLVRMFARGEGIWSGFPPDRRRRQIEHALELVDELYPTFRWFLYDGLQKYSVPYTIFGPTRCAVYFGGTYFVFNGTEHIRIMTRHFDDLIRAAVVQPNEAKDYLEGLLDEFADG